jgi:UDP-N-acetyl-D-galactosamine dehydrogenase
MNKTPASASTKIAVLGLGYVGLPLALLLSGKYPVTGFDINQQRVDALNSGSDNSGETSPEALRTALQNRLTITTNENHIRDCNHYIVTVPTPVDPNNTPDLAPLLAASQTVGRVISPGDYVIYESTVYPGVTEEECIPVIEKESGLKLNRNFFAGYSPERINPADPRHPLQTIVKVTSGSNQAAAEHIDALYNSILTGGTHKAPSIRVAEASKILENAQRDVNIAFMNEAAKIFNAMGIDTTDVITAAATKWNFLPFKPGLVGGHCISVDPYYLIQKAAVYGIYPRIMSEARRLNDGMGAYVATQTVKLMNAKGVAASTSSILILGFTFKENCPDIRNTKVADIATTLAEYAPAITICDPWADPAEASAKYNLNIIPAIPPNAKYNAIILAVAHQCFRSISPESLRAKRSVVYDVKGFWEPGQVDGRL